MFIDPAAGITNGYHLFLEPEGELRDRCSHIIRALAERYDGPVFPPHITLAARIEAENGAAVCEKVAGLARDLSPFGLSFGECSGEASFFRALYLTINPVPELMQAHDRARECFNLPPEPFQPHLSLFYGTIDEDVREAMKEYIGTIEDSFFIDRVQVYRTEGTADRWKKIGEYVFGA